MFAPWTIRSVAAASRAGIPAQQVVGRTALVAPTFRSMRGPSPFLAPRPTVRQLHTSSLVPVSTSAVCRQIAVQATEPLIPVISFDQFLSTTDATRRVRVAKDLTAAFKTSGFAYLSKHGVDQKLIDKAFKLSAQFFEQPQSVKDRLAWRSPRANRGYVATGRERVTNVTDETEIAKLRNAAPDVKESLEIGREVDPEFTNYWPTEEEVPAFRQTMLELRQALDKLHLEVLRAIALGLGLDPKFFDDKCDQEWHTLRLLHYPPTPVSQTEVIDADTKDTNRAGAHTDYGSLTLLLQGGPGLQVRDPRSGHWVNAPPLEGTIVVNVGDLLSRWSNNVLVSTVHRVTAPALPPGSSDTHTPRRYSIPFFTNPNPDTLVETLTTCVAPGDSPKYGPVVTEKYLEQRLAQTYL